MNVKKDFNSVLNKLDELMTAGGSGGNNSSQLNSGSLDSISRTLKESIELLYNKLSMKMDENMDRSMTNMQNTSFNPGMTQELGTTQYASNNNNNQSRPQVAGVGSDQARMNDIARDSIVPHIAVD